LFHDIPSSAIRLDGNEHTVEFNEVYRVVQESDDQGGLDMWGDPTYRGNVIRYNYWHHIGNWWHEVFSGAGIRLDDAISGVLVYGNVFYRCATGGFGGVQIFGGKDNIVNRNLFVECKTAISNQPWGNKRWREFLVQSLLSPEIDTTLYLSRYKELARLGEDHDMNLICNNLIYKCGEPIRQEGGCNKLVDNVVTQEDPGFTDAMHGIFSLPQNASILKRGEFLQIPFCKIGLYRDGFRNTVPSQAIKKARAE
jgi:hypothetical protein